MVDILLYDLYIYIYWQFSSKTVFLIGKWWYSPVQLTHIVSRRTDILLRVVMWIYRTLIGDSDHQYMGAWPSIERHPIATTTFFSWDGRLGVVHSWVYQHVPLVQGARFMHVHTLVRDHRWLLSSPCRPFMFCVGVRPGGIFAEVESCQSSDRKGAVVDFAPLMKHG